MIPSLLSRYAGFTATHGILNNEKEYISMAKNQNTEGLCWAYALTSSMETIYALKSGNRLMLDPLTMKNHSASWWSKTYKHDNNVDACKSYDSSGAYSPTCALFFMNESKQTMTQQDGENSYLIMSDFDAVSLTSLNQLYTTLDKHKLLYSVIHSGSQLIQSVISEYITNTISDHAVVITAVGTLYNYDGIYVEVLNSWGSEHNYEGLVYIKIADNENDELHNNLNLFDVNYWIDVERTTIDRAFKFELLSYLFIVLFAVSFVINIAIIIKHHMNKQKEMNETNEANENEAINDDIDINSPINV